MNKYIHEKMHHVGYLREFVKRFYLSNNVYIVTSQKTKREDSIQMCAKENDFEKGTCMRRSRDINLLLPLALSPSGSLNL